ncbi:hypothetical protein [Rickettsia endosymbiont of Oedothorax gibbosus]|uniref:hypothetical protein n=1 Tax=Rickettsia endosymbiont of Oedothorax gibbosus TaxID=931099 RepID=UPI002024D546|nr:hypothetical protein [Rickettsia endosymbiont of Oedothorax gibbosus]
MNYISIYLNFCLDKGDHLIESENLKRYQQRREDLVLMLSNEKKRLHHSIDGIDKNSVEKHIKFLQDTSIRDKDIVNM